LVGSNGGRLEKTNPSSCNSILKVGFGTLLEEEEEEELKRRRAGLLHLLPQMRKNLFLGMAIAKPLVSLPSFSS
jgi:hypothetical protein